MNPFAMRYRMRRFMLIAILSGTLHPLTGQTGSAVLTCNVNVGVPPIVRADGLAELVGDVVLVCSGGTPGQTISLNLSASLNTNITSRVIGGASEALLLVDEPPVNLFVAGQNAFRGTVSAANQVTWSGVPFTAPRPG